MIARRDKTHGVVPSRPDRELAVGSVVRWRVWLAIVVLLGITREAARAQEMVDPRLEYNVKAVSLYAFGRYVTWPESAFAGAESPFVIGTMGGNPFGDALQRIAQKKKLNGRPIEVRQIKSSEESGDCHILFVTRSVSGDDEKRLFEFAAGKPVLLVGESPGFASRGGVINFYHSGGTVRFELNPDRSLENQLSLNAKLLTLGTRATKRQ
jgi:hypothetical protein